jgi:glucokinase
MVRLYCGIDIGGSHIGIGLLDNSCAILGERSVDIDKHVTPDQVVELIFNACNELLDTVTGDIVSIGIGCPGASKDGILIAASNLPEFKNVPLVDMISRKFSNVPTVLLNDANAALSAELRSTDGRIAYHDVKFAAIITIGTGIGVSLYLNGQFYEGASNTIEAGHMIVATHPGASRCPCGQTGCAEVYCSAGNTARRMKELDELIRNRMKVMDKAEAAASGEVDEEPAEYVYESGAKGVFDRAAAGDALADQILEEV